MSAQKRVHMTRKQRDATAEANVLPGDVEKWEAAGWEKSIAPKAEKPKADPAD